MPLKRHFASNDWKSPKFSSDSPKSLKDGTPRHTGFCLSEFALQFSRLCWLHQAFSYSGGQMPVQDKSGKEQVTFALAVVKASVISNREESLRIQAALRVILPGVSVI